MQFESLDFQYFLYWAVPMYQFYRVCPRLVWEINIFTNPEFSPYCWPRYPWLRARPWLFSGASNFEGPPRILLKLAGRQTHDATYLKLVMCACNDYPQSWYMWLNCDLVPLTTYSWCTDLTGIRKIFYKICCIMKAKKSSGSKTPHLNQNGWDGYISVATLSIHLAVLRECVWCLSPLNH